MNDYHLVDSHIRRARLQHSAFIGRVIANGILAAWFDIEQLATHVWTKIKARLETLDEPTAFPPAYF